MSLGEVVFNIPKQVFLMSLLVVFCSAIEEKSLNLSHEMREGSLSLAVQKLVDKATNKDQPSYKTLQTELTYIDLLSQFELGRFLILRGGLNGYWTQYVVSHPYKGRITRLNSEGKRMNTLEAFLLEKAPTTLAMQERYTIFKQEMQKRLFDGCAFLSVPCGVMGDLLELDYGKMEKCSLVGIDLDPESLAEARKYSKEKELEPYTVFREQDAWEISDKETFDVITSSGLIVYEPDRQRVIEFNKKMYDALKPGGCFITGFLTPTEEWRFSEINKTDAALERTVFADILECKWQVFTAEEDFKRELKAAGFNRIEVIYDRAHIFPTVIAYKSCDQVTPPSFAPTTN